MTLKIHLPLRASDRAPSPAPPQAQSNSVRAPGRWFRRSAFIPEGVALQLPLHASASPKAGKLFCGRF